jgi:hypothetical protein
MHPFQFVKGIKGLRFIMLQSYDCVLFIFPHLIVMLALFVFSVLWCKNFPVRTEKNAADMVLKIAPVNNLTKVTCAIEIQQISGFTHIIDLCTM